MSERRAPSGEAVEFPLQQAYWRNRMRGELPETALPLDNRRRNRPRNDYAEMRFVLPASTARRLVEITKGTELSTYIVLLTALHVLIYKYTGNGDQIVGSPVYKEKLDPSSVNTAVPIRTRLSGNITFRELLIRTKDNVLQAYSNQDCTFESWSGSPAAQLGTNRGAMFDLMLLLENIHDDANVDRLNIDVAVALRLAQDRIRGRILFNREIFRKSTIDRFRAHYLNVLADGLDRFDAALAELQWLAAHEQHQLVFGFNDSHAGAYPTDRTLHRLFERQCETTPDRIAAVHEGALISYRALNARANQVARRLRDAGVGSGARVAILHRRTIDFLIGILATFKAGAAYVPIDPAYPSDRIGHMLDHSRSSAVISESSAIRDGLIGAREGILCTDAVPEGGGPQSVEIYGPKDCVGLSEENLRGLDDAGTPAYMIYTSGSTGTPKGVVIPHRGAVNHLYAELEALNFSTNCAFLQSASCCFDISVWQFLAPLMIGGRTVIISDMDLIPERLFTVLRDQRITHVELVPLVLQALLDHISGGEGAILPDLEWMMVTGEALPPALVDAWLRVFPGIPMANAYGPTEASDDVAQLAIDRPPEADCESVPIGRAIRNMAIVILSERLELVPIGVPGELCSAGVGVGYGYWRDAAKTAEVFVPNPFADKGGDVLYRTGDEARWLPDGMIEFLGRKDRQIKIHGFRVELGEIEAVLTHHPAVRAAVASVSEPGTSNVRLLCHLVFDEARPVAEPELRRYAQDRLPAHMIPSAFIVIDRIPTLASGKIDYHRLPAPAAPLRGDAVELRGPESETEKQIAGIWAEVLQRRDLGVNQSFFDLGGHSLHMVQVLARLKTSCELDLTLAELFEYPTIRSLAGFVDRKREGAPRAAPSDTLGRQRLKGRARLSHQRSRRQKKRVE